MNEKQRSNEEHFPSLDLRSTELRNIHASVPLSESYNTQRKTRLQRQPSGRREEFPCANKKELMRLTINDLQLMPVHRELCRNVCMVRAPIKDVLVKITSWTRTSSVTCKLVLHESLIDCWANLCNSHRVHFVVNLWRSDSSQPGDKNEIAVQLERRSGCAVALQAMRRSLYQTIQTMHDSTGLRCAVNYNSLIPTTSFRVCSRMKRTFAQNEVGGKKCRRDFPSCHETIIRCHDMLESDCCDERRLGMESLVCLTDPSLTSQDTAEKVAKALLMQLESRSRYLCALRSQFLQYLRDKGAVTEIILSHNSSDDDMIVIEFAEKHFLHSMHTLALKVLSNSLQVLLSITDELEINKFIENINNSSPLWNQVFITLAVDLADATNCPQDAALAAKCLSIIYYVSPGSPKFLMDDRLLPFLLLAQNIGEERYFELEQQVLRLIAQADEWID